MSDWATLGFQAFLKYFLEEKSSLLVSISNLNPYICATFYTTCIRCMQFTEHRMYINLKFKLEIKKEIFNLFIN